MVRKCGILLVSWGAHWYESNNQWEVILEEGDDIEFHIESLVQGTVKTEKILFGETSKASRVLYKTSDRNDVSGEKTCKITVRDVGFGDFFLPTDFREEKGDTFRRIMMGNLISLS